MADWVTISALATAGGTLVLAGATFASVRSANRAARSAERSLLAGIRPLVIPSRLEDPPQKVNFIDGKWLTVGGGRGAAEVTDEAIYLAMAIRNVGTGIAVLHGWHMSVGQMTRQPHVPVEDFTRLGRDIYVPAGETGFWQGTFRDPASDGFRRVRAGIEAQDGLTVDVLYGDAEGGQRAITRFTMAPRDDGAYMVTAGRHWNVDRDDPR